MGSIVMDNEGSTSSPAAKPSLDDADFGSDSSSRRHQELSFRQWTKNIFVWLVCLFNVPPYTMALCVSLYFALVCYAPWPWVRSALLYLYLPYCFLDRSHQTGRGLIVSHFPARWREWLRHLGHMKVAAQYFPVQLHKTADLSSPSLSPPVDNSKNNHNSAPPKTVLFCYLPHGVIGMGVNSALTTNACHFDKVFADDIVPSKRLGVTLNFCFMIPFFREWILAMGYCSANKETLRRNLLQGHSLILVPGGSMEATLAQPGTMRLLSHRRRGFLRVALDCQVPVVPCFGFGENATFSTHVSAAAITGGSGTGTESGDNKDKTSSSTSNVDRMIHTLQQHWCRWTTFAMPVLKSLSPVPTPVNVVVGAPVHPPPINNNTDDNAAAGLEDFHWRYWKEVQELYDQHKGKYGHQDIPLEFV